LDAQRLRKLAGLLTEAQTDRKVLPIGLYFSLSDAANMRKAVDALLEAGLEVDLSLSMGVYYFNFKNDNIAEEAHKVVAKVIDKKKEQKWSE
jgi:hypothetical protein